jgi:hypothetical protein
MQLPFVHAQGSEEKGKPPVWKHGFEVKVRKTGEKDFRLETKGIGIEVYQDESNGNLIYVSETGSIAVVPAAK